MSTLLQKKLAENIIQNVKTGSKKNKKELVVSAGYSEISAESSAHLILEAQGVKDELKALGFDTENAKRVVAEILNKEKAQDKDRLKAADMIFEVHGDKAAEKHINVDLTPLLVKFLDAEDNRNTEGV